MNGFDVESDGECEESGRLRDCGLFIVLGDGHAML